MGSVIDFPAGVIRPSHPCPDQVLKRALVRDLTEVTVIGMTSDGNAYYSTTLRDAGHIILTIEELKRKLLEGFGS